MAVTIQTLGNGDTNYIGKHNANYAALKAAVDALLGVSGAGISIPSALSALFGPDVAVIGAASYECSGASTTLTVQPGFAWLPATNACVVSAAAVDIDFAGLTAATYYVVVSNAGTPSRSDTSTDALYSIEWTGSAFGAIARVAAVVWGAADWVAAQTSTALGDTYDTLDARLEAAEALIVDGATVASVAAIHTESMTAGHVTLDGTEFGQHVTFGLTGAPGAARNLVLPATAKLFAVLDDCTGGYAVTVKVDAGASVTLADGDRALLYSDGTDVVVVARLAAADTSHPYHVGGGSNEILTASQVMVRWKFPVEVVFPANLTGSTGVVDSGSEATADADFDILKGGSSVGTMTFADGASSPTFTFASETTFAAGDVLRVVAPASPDATLCNFSFALAGTRSTI